MSFQLPANITAKPGQIVRFTPMGHFLRVLDRRTNGLGMDYLVQADGTMVRDIF